MTFLVSAVQNATITIFRTGYNSIYKERDVILIVNNESFSSVVILKQACDDGGYLVFSVIEGGVNNTPMYELEDSLIDNSFPPDDGSVVNISAIDDLEKPFFDTYCEALSAYLPHPEH
ncbi:hypothetical protein [Photobacterium kishitanii]|uniref:Uncharacterized protein n=1 Tax=Photobacterium kishitanii TaxID=318456 RepID=A0A2T3KAZ1_9GAMM|nr:hypothetical protein [Photobacterium kishitanii]PSU89786.1 hypothetical protein C9J27_24195 [Photobacterium kishitanii]